MAPKKEHAKPGDQGQGEVQAFFDEANEQGYIGEVPDPTPNSAYTVAGVTAGAPTPETDADAKAEAAKAAQEADQA